MEGHKLFVYGTLRNGFSRHRYLSGKAKFLRKGTVCGQLYDLGDYPGVLLSNEGVVKGEVYEFTESSNLLQQLDRIEGFDPSYPERSLFVRKLTDVTLDDGKIITAWIYILPAKSPAARLISNGDYTNSGGRS